MNKPNEIIVVLDFGDNTTNLSRAEFGTWEYTANFCRTIRQ